MTRLALLCVVALACGGDRAPAPSGPAGKVLGVEGEVSATRPGAESRGLAVHVVVFADDTVRTGEVGSVSIRIDHNGAVWRLGPGTERVVSKSAAWRAEQRAGTLASSIEDPGTDRTAAAGRHAERQAAQIGTRGGELGERAKDTDDDQEGGGGAGGAKGGDGTLGLGEMGTIGHGGGGSTGSGYGRGAGKLDGRKSSRPRASLGVAHIKGPLPKEVVRRVLRRKSVNFARCAERASGDKMYQGVLRIELTVLPAGELSQVTVTATPSSDTMETCVRTAVRTLAMPEADSASVVQVDLTFAMP